MFRMLRQNEHGKHMLLYLNLKLEFPNFFRFKSHYTSLGLNSDASPQEIKSAYYKLSLKFHPDKNKGSKESVEKFREISEAYEVLGNSTKKKTYDESLNKFSETEWRDTYYSPRSSQFKSRSSSTRTGRNEYYNYDEHYRQHYEEYYRQRQADYEYIKRRWEADYRRRNPYSDSPPNWSRYQRREPFPPFSWKILMQNRSFIYFMTIWILMFVFTFPKDMDDLRPKNTTFYYKVHDDDDEKTKE